MGVINNTKLSPAMEDYLKEIYRLEQENRSARVSDISVKMEVRKASVVSAVNFLKQQGLLTQEPYGHINLTGAGREEAEAIVKKYDIIYNFFTGMLKLDPDAAKKEACAAEHSLSKDTVLRMAQLAKDAGRAAAQKGKRPGVKKKRR